MNSQNDYSGWLVSGPVIFIYIAVAVLMIVAMWKIFTKAGEPGWMSIIPFLNIFVLFKIAGLNPWLFLLLLIPFVNIVVAIMLAIKLGAAFGKSGVWSFFMLVVLSTIGYLILGYGSAQYQRPAVA